MILCLSHYLVLQGKSGRLFLRLDLTGFTKKIPSLLSAARTYGRPNGNVADVVQFIVELQHLLLETLVHFFHLLYLLVSLQQSAGEFSAQVFVVILFARSGVFVIFIDGFLIGNRRGISYTRPTCFQFFATMINRRIILRRSSNALLMYRPRPRLPHTQGRNNLILLHKLAQRAFMCSLEELSTRFLVDKQNARTPVGWCTRISLSRRLAPHPDRIRGYCSSSWQVSCGASRCRGL